MTRGGFREGSGRPVGSKNSTPRTDKKMRSFRLNEREYERVKQFVRELRKEG